MLTISRSGRYENLGDISPFIYRLETWLRMANIRYQSELGSTGELIAQAPRGLIPFVRLDDETIGDSSIIIERLKTKHGDALLDSRLSAEQNSVGTLVKSLCEHELFYILIYGRWVDGDVDSFAQHLVQNFPEAQRSMAVEAAKKSVIGGMLHGYRLGRYDADFVRQALRDKLDALCHFLGDTPYLFDESPSTIDAGLYSILASFIHFPLSNPHVEIARGYLPLVEYCDRIKADFYACTDWRHGA